jgi:hypothetical protein
MSTVAQDKVAQKQQQQQQVLRYVLTQRAHPEPLDVRLRRLVDQTKTSLNQEKRKETKQKPLK